MHCQTEGAVFAPFCTHPVWVSRRRGSAVGSEGASDVKQVTPPLGGTLNNIKCRGEEWPRRRSSVDGTTAGSPEAGPGLERRCEHMDGGGAGGADSQLKATHAVNARGRWRRMRGAALGAAAEPGGGERVVMMARYPTV
uniref:Uncharacterized protein n=1 Tax=Knipowitschia caucasica TaxID=637954 RepID=A0AAV2LL50_KNICA